MTRTTDFQSVDGCEMMPGNLRKYIVAKLFPERPSDSRCHAPSAQRCHAPCGIHAAGFLGVFHSLAAVDRWVRWRWGLVGNFAEGLQEFALPWCQLFGFRLEVA